MLKKDNRTVKRTLKALAFTSVILGQLLPILWLICESLEVSNLNKAYKVNSVLLLVIFLSMFVMNFTFEQREEESEEVKCYKNISTLYNMGLFIFSVLIPVASLCFDVFIFDKKVSATLDKIAVYGTALLLTISCIALTCNVIKFCCGYFSDNEVKDNSKDKHNKKAAAIGDVDVEKCFSNIAEKI